MEPNLAFTVRTRDDRFQVLLYPRAAGRSPFAEYCGSSPGCERVSRIGVPQNLVFPDDAAVAEWLLKACLADIAVAAGSPVRSVRQERPATQAA